MAKRWKRRKSIDDARTANPTPLSTGPAKPMLSIWRSWLGPFLLIVSATLWIYWPVWHGGWLLDDRWYFPDNSLLTTIQGLGKFWFQPGSWVEYYPIHETVMWIEWQLWGDNTLGYHIVSVLLHITSALLLWRLLSKWGLRLAWLGGLLFAVHPILVESVANIAELKNTLSLPPYLLAMCAWVDYEEHRRDRDYIRSFAWFVVAMLCKISMAAFPVILLLYAWWKHRQVRWGDLKASAPFFAVSLVLAYASIASGQRYEEVGHGHPDVILLGGLWNRVAGSGLNLAYYFSQSFLPVILSPFHRKWKIDPSQPLQFLPWVVFAGVVFIAWIKRESWGRHVLLGLGFFVLTLLPFLGFFPVSYMSMSWTLDHLLYLPIIGILGLIVAGLEIVETRLSAAGRLVSGILVFAALLTLGWKGHNYAKLYTNEEVLWNDVLRQDPTSWLAHNNLGSYFSGQKQFPEATTHFHEAIRLNPDFDGAHYGLGVALEKAGESQSAEVEYREALRLNPDNFNAISNLGLMLQGQGKLPEAEALYRQGLKAVPDNAMLCVNLGGLLLKSGRRTEAIESFARAVASNPNVAQLQYDLGAALLETGRLPEAIEHLALAAQLDPKMVAAHVNLGSALAQTGHLNEAIDQLQTALEMNPTLTTPRLNLALALAQSGRLDESIQQFQQVLQQDPNNARARDALAKLQHYQLEHALPTGH